MTNGNSALGRVGERVADTVGGMMGAATHAVKTVNSTAEDVMYKTGRQIKRHPVRSVLVAFGTAFAGGLLVGRMLRRR
ncbi:MAG TPA: hypothetical protein VGS20_02335 [Candidatus Acidoferrales bacterium]|nr:hypothetical protein [Candidatus Acidoferrales bacterium]